MDIIVDFVNVGRDKKSWRATLASLSDRAMFNEVSKKKVLMSKILDFVWHESGEQGVILAGMRPVGEFRVENGAKLHD